jgi:hypothetical protein
LPIVFQRRILRDNSIDATPGQQPLGCSHAIVGDRRQEKVAVRLREELL